MKTTAVLFEYLATGVLTLASLLFLYASFFPESQLLDLLKTWSGIQAGLLLGVLTAAAYSAGVIAESAGRICFEWLLDRKKKQWDYFDRNKERENDPILTQYHECVEKAARHVGSTQRQNPECVLQAIGAMKTLVMKDSPDMYREVEANVNKMRLIRPLFLIEGVLLFVIGWRTSTLLAVASVLLPIVVLSCIHTEKRWPWGRYLAYVPFGAIVVSWVFT